MKKFVFSCLVLVFVLTLANSHAFAQKETDTGIQVEKDIQLIRRDLRAEKKKIIAMNLTLTEAEATKFWVVYEQYAEDMRKIYDGFYKTIKEYAENQKTLTDEQAISTVRKPALPKCSMLRCPACVASRAVTETGRCPANRKPRRFASFAIPK